MIAKNRWDIVCLLILLVTSYLTSSFVGDDRYALNPDGCRILNVAMNFENGNGFVDTVVDPDSLDIKLKPVVTKPPLYSALIAFLIKMGIPPKKAGWLISQASFILAAVTLFGIARIFLPLLPAFLVGFLFCFQISGIIWSIHVKEDMLFVFLVFVSLLLISTLKKNESLEKHWYLWVLLGITTAFAVLTRYIGIALLFTIIVILFVATMKKNRHVKQILLFMFGVTITGIGPLLRFVLLWFNGARPSFIGGSEPTWFEISAAMITRFQIDYLGSPIVWLYDGSMIDLIVLTIAFLILIILLAVEIRNNYLIVDIALFIAFYLLTLLVLQGSSGVPAENFDKNYALPVEGLILFLAVSFFWRGYTKNKKNVVYLCMGLMVFFAFCNGQIKRFKEFNEFSIGNKVSREICNSPETMDWIFHNIPKESKIFGPQGCFQLLAESIDYYWLPIPPADKYSTTKEFHERWSENDFIKISRATGARWIVIFKCENGDPLLVKLGYGEFVEKLFEGKETNQIKLVVKLEEGYIYRIEDLIVSSNWVPVLNTANTLQ